MSKLLSIIIPVYNMEKYLTDCLDSVILPEQEHCYEVIIINDGSSDSSLEIAKKYQNKYPALFKLYDKQNGGYGSCFNEGKKIAEGKYIKMLDSDDFFYKNALSSILELLCSNDADVFISDVIQYDEKIKKEIGKFNNHQTEKGFLTDLNTPLMKDLFLHHFTFKKSLLIDCVCPEHTLYTDGLISISAIAKAKSFFFTGISLYGYRLNRTGQSVNPSVYKRKYKDCIRVLEEDYKVEIQNQNTNIKNVNCAILSGMENPYHFALLGISQQKTNRANYIEYKKLRKGFKTKQRRLKCKTSSIKGKLAKCSVILPASIGYVLLKIYSIKRLEKQSK